MPNHSTAFRFVLCTVAPLNKGHVGDSINSAVIALLEVFNIINFGTSSNVLCIEVYYTVSLLIFEGPVSEVPL